MDFKPYDWKTKTWACNQLKAKNWSTENFKKIRDID